VNATPEPALLDAAKAGNPQAQTRVGIGFFSRGQHADALPWLERASQQNVPEACNLLGLMHLNGIGVSQRPAVAVSYLQQAAERGLKQACYTLGNLQFNGIGTPADEVRACDNLLKAAEMRHWPALRTLGMLHCLSDPERAPGHLALYCLRLAAHGGDALAQYVLAAQLMLPSSPDGQAEGLYWLQQAAARRVYCAVTRLQQLVADASRGRVQASPANHSAGSPDAGIKLSVPELKMLDQGTPPLVETLAPATVWQINKVLAPLICEHFMNLAMPALTPSYVADPETGTLLTNEMRTSTSMYFQLSMYDFIAGLALRRIARLAGHDIAQAEPLAVLRYLPGQQYKPHFDYFVSRGNREELVDGRGGQRQTTLFVYLNNVEAGGETDFPLLHACVAPAQGKAVKFVNLDANGEPNSQTLHAGKPVIRGEKWLLTVWFRQRPFVWGELTTQPGT